jgi:hypothetical protein
VSWCGRFNLGISLIDWLCDEAAVAPSAIACLPAFAPLTATRRRDRRRRMTRPSSSTASRTNCSSSWRTM